jgi:6-methylsalicylate decarboxylase
MVAAQTVYASCPPEATVTFTVDTHHHMLLGFFWEATEGDDPVGGLAPRWSRASALSFLDDAGIDVAITSISARGVHTGGDAAARLLARRCNELAAELIRDRPDRFGGFACLPLPDVDGALAELAYALDDLQLDGVLLFSNARGVYRGDSQFPPLFDELQRRGRGVRASQSLARSQRPRARTARHAYRLHCRYHQGHRPAALQQHLRPHARRQVHLRPRRKYRALPGRAVRHHRRDARHPRSRRARDCGRDIPPPVLGYRGVLGRSVLRMLRDVVGIDSVVFGTDYPSMRRDLAVSCREHIEAAPELTDGERTAVLGATATTLIPRLAALRPRTRTRALSRDRDILEPTAQIAAEPAA